MWHEKGLMETTHIFNRLPKLQSEAWAPSKTPYCPRLLTNSDSKRTKHILKKRKKEKNGKVHAHGNIRFLLLACQCIPQQKSHDKATITTIGNSYNILHLECGHTHFSGGSHPQQSTTKAASLSAVDSQCSKPGCFSGLKSQACRPQPTAEPRLRHQRIQLQVLFCACFSVCVYRFCCFRGST